MTVEVRKYLEINESQKSVTCSSLESENIKYKVLWDTVKFFFFLRETWDCKHIFKKEESVTFITYHLKK